MTVQELIERLKEMPAELEVEFVSFSNKNRIFSTKEFCIGKGIGIEDEFVFISGENND